MKGFIHSFHFIFWIKIGASGWDFDLFSETVSPRHAKTKLLFEHPLLRPVGDPQGHMIHFLTKKTCQIGLVLKKLTRVIKQYPKRGSAIVPNISIGLIQSHLITPVLIFHITAPSHVI